jgi:excisionase family DNA binding protein
MKKRKKTYTLSEAAKILKISRAAVHKAIKEGRLKARAHKIKRIVWRVDAPSVRGYKVSRAHQKLGRSARS